MIAESLRKSILQAAIQGRLTEQLPEDGDAKDLLAEIQAEKARLIKAGIMKKETPLPVILEDEIPFDIPENWCWCRIGQVFYLQAGKFISSDSIKVEGKYPCYGGNGLRGYVDICNRSGRFPIIGRQGALCGNINVADGEFYATEHAVVVKGHCNCIADWAARFLRALNLNQYATATAQPGLAVNKINQIPFPLPPVGEQQRIVVAIEEAFEKINDLEKDELKLALLQKSFPKKMKDSLLQAAIQGKLTEQLEADGDARDLVAKIQKEKARLINEGKIKNEKALPEITEDEIPFEIPENWCWVRLGNALQVNPRNHLDDDLEVSFVPMAVISEGYTNRFEAENRIWKSIKSGFTHFAENDVVLAKITPCFQNLKSAVMVNLRNGFGAGTTELHVLRRYKEQIDCKYLLYFLKNPVFIKDGLATMKGTAGQQRVSTDFIKEYLFPLPPFAEQRRIIERLEQLLPLCDALE